MGNSSSSRPSTRYPFPMPGNEPVIPFKAPKWSFSTRKKSRKDKELEKLDDFVPKYPLASASTAGTYGFPYYPQPFPAYYAPVQMAFVQPVVQQPVLAMPQGYLPMSYQTTAAPIQPAVAPVLTQPTSAMRMPAPAPAPAPVSAPPSALTPASAPILSALPPAVTQMPQPPPGPPQAPFSRYPPSPILAEPVIPPPPILSSEPPRAAPDSGRVRFTDFYRTPDAPRRPTFDEPVHPPPSGLPGRTPYAATMPMPDPASTPAPLQMPSPTLGPAPPTVPVSNNPLPQPPADIWDTSPYRHVLANLPSELPDILGQQYTGDVLVADPDPNPGLSRVGSIFGSRDKGKKPLRGLFRSRSTSAQADIDIGSSSGSRHGHTRSQTMTSIVIPPPVNGVSPSTTHPSGLDMPVPTAGPPIKFDHTGEFAGFVNHSPHRVMHKNKMYPTALHLLEAMKFTHQPGLQERIRTCKDVTDMYPLSASLQEHVRPDWGQVFLRVMEDVLYLKFKQHPTLRALLLGTGLADIVYADENAYWGEGPTGDGRNELGNALVRLRERLRQEGDI